MLAKVHVFDLESFVKRAVEQGEKMLKNRAWAAVGDSDSNHPEDQAHLAQTPNDLQRFEEQTSE